MTSPYNVVYPRKDHLFFDGGMNSKYDRALIADNESPDCQNVIFDAGSVETRGGTDQFNTASVGSFVCDGFYTRHETGGNNSMTAWWNGSLYVASGTTLNTIASAQSVFTAGVRVGSAEYEDYIFYGNGGSIPYKYNGTAFTRHGIYAPNSAPTPGTAPSGTTLTGDYQYKVTYVNTNLVESDVNTATSTFTAAAEDIRLTSLPVAPQSFGVSARKIYRTEAGGTDFKLLDTISDNTTTTYDDGKEDGELGADAPTDQGVPPNYQAILYHQARLFVIDPVTNFVKYSEIGNPYVFKATSFRRIGDTTGDIPVGLEIYDNSVVVACRKSMWVIYMPDTDPTNWQDIRIKTALGCRSPFGMFRYNNRVMFPATLDENFVGFAAISGQTTEATATLLTIQAVGSEFKSDKIEPEMKQVVEAYVKNITSLVFDNKAYISVTHGTGNTTNNRVWYFDFLQENLETQQSFAWAPWTGINAAQFAIYNNLLYYGESEDTGLVCQAETSTYSDKGSAIDSYYWTKEFGGDPKDYTWIKDWRYANFLLELVGDYYMNLNIRRDSDKGSGQVQQISLNPGGSLWGSAILGVDIWDAGKDQKDLKHFLGQMTSKRIQFKFSNQNAVNQKFKMIGLILTYNRKGRR